MNLLVTTGSSRNTMAHKFSFSYYYISPEDDKKITDFCEASGDTPQYIRMQYIRGWLGRNREYYTKLARMDCRKRGITAKEWKKIVLHKGFDKLPAYQTPPNVEELGVNPLGHIALPPNVIKKPSHHVKLTGQNLVLLRTAIFYDQATPPKFLSRIFHEHLERNWESLYAPQIAAENSDDWLGE